MAKALVVDDSKAMRMLIGRLLREIGFEVVEAENGKRALEMVEVEGINVELILADWNMPEVNGIELLKRLRHSPAFASIAFIMVTTETELDHMTEALDAGASEYVMKPFTKEILLEKLHMTGIQC
ncbi:MAG TPA: response regulator [Terracidiphilus sp.]|nr:response regulator [Terracidiphilus sp.]